VDIEEDVQQEEPEVESKESKVIPKAISLKEENVQENFKNLSKKQRKAN
jgi:hypothetical protein